MPVTPCTKPRAGGVLLICWLAIGLPLPAQEAPAEPTLLLVDAVPDFPAGAPIYFEADWQAVIQGLIDTSDPGHNRLIAGCYDALAWLERQAGETAAARKLLTVGREWDPALQYRVLAETVSAEENLPETLVALNTLIEQLEEDRLDWPRITGTEFLRQMLLHRIDGIDRKIIFYSRHRGAVPPTLRQFQDRLPDDEHLRGQLLMAIYYEYQGRRAKQREAAAAAANERRLSDLSPETIDRHLSRPTWVEDLLEIPGMQVALADEFHAQFPGPTSLVCRLLLGEARFRRAAALLEQRGNAAREQGDETAAGKDWDRAEVLRARAGNLRRMVTMAESLAAALGFLEEMPDTIDRVRSRLGDQVDEVSVPDPDFIAYLVKRATRLYDGVQVQQWQELYPYLEALSKALLDYARARRGSYDDRPFKRFVRKVERLQEGVERMVVQGEWRRAQEQRRIVAELVNTGLSFTEPVKPVLDPAWLARLEAALHPPTQKFTIQFNPYFLRALVHRGVGDAAAALADLDRAVAFNKRLVATRFGMRTPAGEAAREATPGPTERPRIRRPDQKTREELPLISIGLGITDDFILNNRGVILAETGDLDGAEAAFKTARRLRGLALYEENLEVLEVLRAWVAAPDPGGEGEEDHVP